MPALRLVCPLAVVPTAPAGCGAPPLDIRGLRVVPGGVGSRQVTAHRTTLSTCATPEGHAAGNYRSEAIDNPEHRIDKIGVLVRTARR